MIGIREGRGDKRGKSGIFVNKRDVERLDSDKYNNR